MSTEIRMGQPTSDIGLQVANPSKSVANLIEWNVDMRVTVSNVRKSKVLQKSRNVVIFLLAIVFAVVLSHLRKEVRALQVQMHCVNVNLLVLMSKYDRLNRNLNRAWFQRSNGVYKNASSASVRRTVEDLSPKIITPSESHNVIRSTAANSHPHDFPAPFLSSPPNAEDASSFDENIGIVTDDRRSVDSPKAIRNKVGIKSGINSRIERAILTLEKQNSTALDARLEHDIVEDEDDDLDSWREARSGRSRRDEGRGPLVATFVGAIPEQHVTDAVYIGPWVKSTKNDSQYSFNKFHLVEDKKSIEVTASGLYMISAQIFYFGEPTNFSYWLLLSSEGKSATQKLVKCSTASSTSATEISCYTSIITFLRKGDRLHIQQQERNRLINMREGHSYVQLVLLSNNNHKRRLT
ncbi:hypothetical protein KM043_009364 [Ampulex compressa]|nr:hypothetical protein KM043_009364 [Ampulex compressa]